MRGDIRARVNVRYVFGRVRVKARFRLQVSVPLGYLKMLVKARFRVRVRLGDTASGRVRVRAGVQAWPPEAIIHFACAETPPHLEDAAWGLLGGGALPSESHDK